MNKNESEDQLVQHKDGKVDVETLTFEYRRSLTDGHALERIQSADDVRYARWNSQTSDFKKHASALSEGTQPFPFEGAADNRIRLADETINQLVATMMNGFQKAQLKVGATESSDTEAAASMHGPSSTKSPKNDDAPGPPFVHSRTGAVAGSLSASMNM